MKIEFTQRVPKMFVLSAFASTTETQVYRREKEENKT